MTQETQLKTKASNTTLKTKTNGKDKALKHKNPHHPYVVRFIDGNIKNTKIENMQLVPLIDAVKHNYATTADVMYPKSYLASLKDQIEIIPLIKEVVVKVLQEYDITKMDVTDAAIEIATNLLNSDKLVIKKK